VTPRTTPDHGEVDVTTTRTWRRLGAALVAAAALAAVPAADAVPLTPNCTPSGAEQLCEVWATAGTISVAGIADPVPVWRFTDSGGNPLPPVVVTQGDTVRVRLHNTLATPVSLALPQIPNTLHGAGLRGADTTGAAQDAAQEYVFTATRPGTFLYEAGPTPSGKQQVAMGLTGALVVLPTTAGQVYGSASTAYDDEDVLVLSDLDPSLNTSADPTTFNMRGFHALRHLVNGQAAVRQITATAGARFLLRYVNAGVQNRWAGLIGLDQAQLGTNGEPLANLLTGVDQERSGVVAPLPAGGTTETRVTMPDTASAGFRYPLFDEGLTTSDTGDGALAYLELAGTANLPACPDAGAGPIPPLVHDLSAPPAGHIADLANPSAATTVFTVTGRGLECRGVAGEQPADTVRYAIDAIPGASAATAQVSNTGDFQIALSETDVASIANGGHHYLIVQAGVGGTFGAISAVQLIVDNAAPDLDLAGDPATVGAGGSLAITGTASDRFLGDSNVTRLDWTLDGGPATTVTVDPAVTVGVDIAVPAAGLAEGGHTVAVTATDAFGNTSAATSLQLIYDPTPPTLSGVVIEQRLPASTQYPFGGPLTTSNNGTLTFDPNIWAIRVRGTATDGLSTIAAMRGSFDDRFCTTTAGEPAISGARLDPKDGAWSSGTEAGFVYVPLSELNRWLPAAGQPAVVKAFHVRARDAAGNWSACGDGSVTLDRTNPAITVPLQLAITGAGELAAARSSRAKTTLVVRLSARDAGGLSIGEFFDGDDPGRGKGTVLLPTAGALGTQSGLIGALSLKRATPGVHHIHARVRDRAGNWSPLSSADISVSFPKVTNDGFESGKVHVWHRTGGSRVAVTRSGALHGRFGVRVRTARRPAFLTDLRPHRLKSYRASFGIAAGRSSTGGGWQTVFAAVDQHGRTALAVQRRTGAGSQVVRITVLRHGRSLASSQTLLGSGRHTIAIVWRPDRKSVV